MSIPRVVIGVTERDGYGWRVTVGDGAESMSPDEWAGGYDMDAVAIEVGGFRRRLPVVPADRRPPDSAPHAALCAGDEDALRSLLDRVAASETEGDDVSRYGRWLFECLLAPAWETIRKLPEVVKARGVELALDWPVTSSDLHWLLWEAMHDDTTPLAGHRDLLVAITRLVPVDLDPPVTINRVPRMLFAVGSALTDQVIRPGAMFMGLLRKFDADGLCATRTVQHVSVDDLGEECRAFRPDIVHLVAHGDHDDDGNGVVVLANDRPGGGAVHAEQLLTALTERGCPMLVALSACHSGLGGAGFAPLAAQLVDGGIPIVSAMAGEVSEPACRLYTRRLVSAIYEGESAVEAVAHGRRAALRRSEHSNSKIDWALPALFLAHSVKPEFRVVDPAPIRQLVELADQLMLRRQPVYVGRREVFERVDELFAADPRHRLGFVGLVNDGPIKRLGGTRLLYEIGFRLLREGHVPLLLGPYSQYAPPSTLRAVLVEIFQKAVLVAEQLDISPPQVTALAADSDFAEAERVTESALAKLPPQDGRHLIRVSLSKFREADHPDRRLDPDVVRPLLAEDLSALARAIGMVREPFGPHTRVVVLADSLHAWTNVLGDLLKMVNKAGLGTSERPAPLIGTSSLSEGNGPALKTWSEEHSGMPWVAFPQLTTLPDGEATLGFQWVLLHPWQYDRGQAYRRVYVSARGRSDRVHLHLRTLEGVPTAVERELYILAQALATERLLLADDDDAAYRAYTEEHG